MKELTIRYLPLASLAMMMDEPVPLVYVTSCCARDIKVLNIIQHGQPGSFHHHPLSTFQCFIYVHNTIYFVENFVNKFHRKDSTGSRFETQSHPGLLLGRDCL